MRDKSGPFSPMFADYEFQSDYYVAEGASARPLEEDPRPLTDEVSFASKVIIYPPAPSPQQVWAVVVAEGSSVAETVEHLLPFDWQYEVSHELFVADEVKHLALMPGIAHRVA